MLKKYLTFIVLVWLLNTSQSQTITDYDGNVYNTVNIGSQCWMKENLKTTKYRDGTNIPNVTDNATWEVLTTGARSYYNNDSTANAPVYGALYNWYAATNAHNLCPTGWHVPSDAEWTSFENYLIANDYNYDGTITGNKYAKSLATTIGWNLSTTIGAVGNTDFPTYRNKSGFSALPGGYRNYNGSFSGNGYGTGFGYWWSSTESSSTNAWNRLMYYSYAYVIKGSYSYSSGFSVRCLQDNNVPGAAGSISGPSLVCQGQTNVNYTVPAIVNATSYMWTLPTGASGTSTTNSIYVNFTTSAITGNITVKGINIYGNGAISTMLITVNVIAPTPIIIFTGNILHSDAVAGNQWYNQNGLIAGATNQNFIPTIDGDYYVIVTNNGCNPSNPSNTIHVTVTINQCLPSYVPLSGIVGWWPFCGNTNDESGNSNNGTNNGAIFSNDRFGNSYSAVSLNGTNNISIIPSSIAAFGTSSFSTSLWFKTTMNTNGDLIRYDDGISGAGWGLRMGYDISNTASSGIIQGLEFSQTRVPNFVASNQMYNDNNWHCAIYVRDISLLKDLLYIDGNLVSQVSFSNINNIISNTNPFNFGSCGNFDYFNGLSDDIGLWNRVLTSQEIFNLYNSVLSTISANSNENNIEIFPNPSNGKFIIHFVNHSKTKCNSLIIKNLLGKTVGIIKIDSDQANIDLSSSVGSGIYFIFVIDAQDNTIGVKKIILQ